MSDAQVIDVFADRATPAFRQARPDLFRARLAWAPRRLQTSTPSPPSPGEGESGAPAPAREGDAPAAPSRLRFDDADRPAADHARVICGWRIGDAVLVETHPGKVGLLGRRRPPIFRRGHVEAWLRGPTVTLAVVRLHSDDGRPTALSINAAPWRLQRPGPQPPSAA